MVFVDRVETILHMLVEVGILCLEFIGVCIVLVTAAKCLWRYIHRKTHVPLALAEGIALALEFKLGGEVLRTVIVHEWKDLMILAGVVALRMALTLLIHWEIKMEKAESSILKETE